MLVNVLAASMVDGFEKPIGSVSSGSCDWEERSSLTSDEELRSKVYVSWNWFVRAKFSYLVFEFGWKGPDNTFSGTGFSIGDFTLTSGVSLLFF